MSDLLAVLAPYIQKEANKWKGNLSPTVLDSEAKRNAIVAIKSYKPGFSALPTHVSNHVKKISRLVYDTSSAGRIPEETVLLMNKAKKSIATFNDQHSRDPSTSELATSLNVPMYKATQITRKLSGQSSIGEANTNLVTAREDFSDLVSKLDVIYYDLSPRDKIIMEHSYGYGGKPMLQNQDIAKKLGTSAGYISQRKTYIDKELKALTKN